MSPQQPRRELCLSKNPFTRPLPLEPGFQRYIVENMITTSVSSYGFLQAARTSVKGYENLHGYKLRFETTW